MEDNMANVAKDLLWIDDRGGSKDIIKTPF